MQRRWCEGNARRRASVCVWLGVVMAGCGSAHARRVGALEASLREAEDAARARGAADPVEGLSRLDRVAFVRAVLARNPSVESARAAFRAALAAYREAGALPDPMVEYAFAPLSIGSGNVSYGQVVTLSQRFPWPGKLALEGAVALAEAEAVREQYDAVRQRLALTASALYDQYYAVGRSLVLNDEATLMVLDERIGQQMNDMFFEDLAYAEEITLPSFRRRPWFDRIDEAAAVLIARVL